MADHQVISGCGDENIGLVAGVIHRDDAEPLHPGLQGANRVDLGNPDDCAEAFQRLRTTLADIAIARNHCDLAGYHDIGCALDAIDQRLAATVQVVKF